MMVICGILFGCYGFSLGPMLFRQNRRALAISVLVLLCAGSFFTNYFIEADFHFVRIDAELQSDGLLMLAALTISCLFGLVCDLLLLGINRSLMRALTKTTSARLVLLATLYNLLWVVLLVDSLRFILGYGHVLMDPFLQLLTNLTHTGDIGNDFVMSAVFDYVFSTNLFTALIASSVLLIMLTALVHRFTWPIVGRVVNAIYQWEILSNRKIQIGLAVSLLVYAIPRLSGVFALFKG